MNKRNRLEQLKAMEAAIFIVGLSKDSYQLAQKLSTRFETFAADPMVADDYCFRVGSGENINPQELSRPNAAVHYLSGTSEFISNWEDLKSYARMIGKTLLRGDWVVFGQEVDPDVVEVVLLPLIEKVSGLKVGVEFEVAFDPESQNTQAMKNLGFEIKVSHNLIVDKVAEILNCSKINAKSFQLNFLGEQHQLELIKQVVAEKWVPILNELEQENFAEFYEACHYDNYLGVYQNLKLKNELRPNVWRFFQYAWETGLKHQANNVELIKKAI